MAANETYRELSAEDFRDRCISLNTDGNHILRLMFATDDRQKEGCFRIFMVFSERGTDRFHIPFFRLKGEAPCYRSLTPDIPAIHWYEREIMDMFGLVPEGHPDPRRLVFHDSFPPGGHPLRKDWRPEEGDMKEWGEGALRKVPYDFMHVEGEGIYEIPVGPVHAGIIEPGHFRFSAVGETIFYLEPRLFYTHKGTERHFESKGFSEGVRLAERVSGTSSFAHATAFCLAVERMRGIEISERAKAVRTLLLELERLYNHIGDIGNMCAGTGLAVGYAKGALIKERCMHLNEKLTGSRYLRGVNTVGGVTRDVFLQAKEIVITLVDVTAGLKDLMRLLLGTMSHVDRLENTGVLSRDIAARLGVTGVAARASGINDDVRKAHPHLSYDRLAFESHTMAKGDALARLMVRSEEAECSLSIINALIESDRHGALDEGQGDRSAQGCALGYTESPRGSVFYWVMADGGERPCRVKLRSPSFCNWPAVPFAVHGNIVPDFPLCNKSFNLSYSGCDM